MSDNANRAMIRIVSEYLARIHGTPSMTAYRDWAITAAASIAALRKAGFLNYGDSRENVVHLDAGRSGH